MSVKLNCEVNNNYIQLNIDGSTPALFVNLVVQHIFSFLPFSDLDTCRHVCKHWQKLAPILFGQSEWKKYFGLDVENVPDSPRFHGEIGKSMMVLIPAKMGPHEFSRLMRHKRKEADVSIRKCAYISKSYWIEVPIEATAVADGGLYHDKISIVNKMGRSIPRVIEALIANGVYHLVTNDYLHRDVVLCEGTYQEELNNPLWYNFSVSLHPVFALSEIKDGIHKFCVYGVFGSAFYKSKVFPIIRHTLLLEQYHENFLIDEF